MTTNNPKTVFVFPGQGSQVVGMGKALAEAYPLARQAFEEANEILGRDFFRLMWEGAEVELNETAHTQPALFIHSLAAYRVLQNSAPQMAPVFMAGHSLGQISALAAAGALSFEQGLRLVNLRGALMKRAGETNPGGMAAILGLDIPALQKVCAEASVEGQGVQVANDNCPGQVVISGQRQALERAMLGAKAAGAKRALPLAVSIAAHSPLMAGIQAEWDAAVDAAGFVDSFPPVVGNVAAVGLSAAADLQADVKAQMQSQVRWTDSVRWLAAQGAEQFVEVGTGSVLGGLIKRILPGARTLSFGAPVDFEAFSS